MTSDIPQARRPQPPRRNRLFGGCLATSIALVVAATGIFGIVNVLKDRGWSLPFHWFRKPTVAGRVLTSAGKPIDPKLGSVHVSVQSLLDRDTYEPKVGPDGTYEEFVPAGRCIVKAWVDLHVHGRPLRVDLHPMNAMVGEETCDKGFQKDFFWPLTGLVPGGNDNDPRDHYGRIVLLYFEDLSIPDTMLVRLNVAPESAHLDGSKGSPRTFQVSVGQLRQNGKLGELPIADYSFTGEATLPDGSTRPLLIEGQPRFLLQLSQAPKAKVPMTVKLGIPPA